MIFLWYLSQNCKICIRNAFSIRFVLLVYKMLIGKNCISSSPIYVSPKISLITGIISFRQSFKIVRNAPSYIFAMCYSFLFCGFIISFFHCKFKNRTTFHTVSCFKMPEAFSIFAPPCLSGNFSLKKQQEHTYP